MHAYGYHTPSLHSAIKKPFTLLPLLASEQAHPMHRCIHWAFCLQESLLGRAVVLVYAFAHYFCKASNSSLVLIITVMLFFLVLYCTGHPYRELTQLTVCYRYNFKLSVFEISCFLNLAALSFGVLCVDCIFPCSSANPTRSHCSTLLIWKLIVIEM